MEAVFACAGILGEAIAFALCAAAVVSIAYHGLLWFWDCVRPEE